MALLVVHRPRSPADERELEEGEVVDSPERANLAAGGRAGAGEGAFVPQGQAGQVLSQRGAVLAPVQREMGRQLEYDKPPHMTAPSFKPFSDGSVPVKRHVRIPSSNVLAAKGTSNTLPTMPRSMRPPSLLEKPVVTASTTLFSYRLPLPYHASGCLFTGPTVPLLYRIKLLSSLNDAHVELGTNPPSTAKLVLVGSEDALRHSLGVIDRVVYHEAWSSFRPFEQAALTARAWLQFDPNPMEQVEGKKPPKGPSIPSTSFSRKPSSLPPPPQRPFFPPRGPRLAICGVPAAAISLPDLSFVAPSSAPPIRRLPSNPPAPSEVSSTGTERNDDSPLPKKPKQKESSSDWTPPLPEEGWQPGPTASLRLPSSALSGASSQREPEEAEVKPDCVRRFSIPPSAAHLFLPNTPSLSVLEALNQCSVTLSTTPRTQEVQLCVKLEDEECWPSVVRAVEGMVRSVEPEWTMSEKQEAAGEAEVSVASRKRRRSEIEGGAPTNLPASIPPIPSFPPFHLSPLPGVLPTQHLPKPPVSTLQPAYHPTHRPSRLPVCAAPPPFRSHRDRSPSFPLSSRSSSPPPPDPPSLPRSPVSMIKYRPFKPVLTASSTEEEDAETSSRTWTSSLLSAGASHTDVDEAERRKLEEEKERRRERDRRRERHRKREEERARREGERV